MEKTGLCSVTFRQFSCRKIIELAKEAQLDVIEWGGDRHVPHGDYAQAGIVAASMAQAGLKSAAYGSYYRIGQSESEGLLFPSVLTTAEELQAPLIRVWAGTRGSADADEAYFRLIADESMKIADLAEKKGIAIAYEYHGGTLMDEHKSIQKLLEMVDHPNLYTLWQPEIGKEAAYCEAGLRLVLSRLANVHVFHWYPSHQERLPLSRGKEAWQRYGEIIAAGGKNPSYILEFVRDDQPAQLLEDAATLRAILVGNRGKPGLSRGNDG